MFKYSHRQSRNRNANMELKVQVPKDRNNDFEMAQIAHSRLRSPFGDHITFLHIFEKVSKIINMSIKQNKTKETK